MRTLTILALLFSIVSTVNGQSTEDALRDHYRSVLSELAIDSEVDQDGDINFNIQDRSFYLAVDISDSTYLQLTRWDVWNVRNVSQAIDVLTLVNEINRDQKVAKLFLSDDMVIITAELYTDGQNDIKALIRKSIEAIVSAENLFLSRF